MAFAATKWLSGKTDRKLELKTVNYEWTITNYRFFAPDETEPLHSDPFEMDDNASWQAVIVKLSDGTLLFGLKFLGSSVFGPFYTTVAEFYCSVKKGHSTVPLFEPTFKDFGSNNSERFQLPGIKLCDFWVKTGQNQDEVKITYCITTEKVVHQFVVPRGQLLRDLDPNNNLRKLTKVDLVVSGKSMIAHKEILVARSPVFAAMFNTKKVGKQVKIDDVTCEVFKQLLQYIYTDKAEFQETTGDGLLAAADTYGLDRLKAGCEHALSEYVTRKTAIKTLILADKHNAQQLKTRLLQFIKTYAEDVMYGNNWNTLVEGHPKLLLEVYQAMAKKARKV